MIWYFFSRDGGSLNADFLGGMIWFCCKTALSCASFNKKMRFAWALNGKLEENAGRRLLSVKSSKMNDIYWILDKA
jgi:hypothetical protein